MSAFHLTRRALAAPSALRFIPAAIRFNSTQPLSQPPSSHKAAPYPQTAHDNSSIVPSVDGSDALRDHQAGGLTTSHPSPEIIAADVLSDAPFALHSRSVRIYSPTKSTMQSAKQGTQHWRIDWDTLQGAGRWENELMGWGSTADYMQGTTMKFRTKEDAIHFAEKQGWDYQVEKAQPARIPPKSYSENFVHIPGKLRRYQTK